MYGTYCFVSFIYLFIPIHPIQSEDFKMIGKLVATSIVQGGPGLPVFSPVAYNYICTEKYSENSRPTCQELASLMGQNGLGSV